MIREKQNVMPPSGCIYQSSQAEELVKDELQGGAGGKGRGGEARGLLPQDAELPAW